MLANPPQKKVILCNCNFLPRCSFGEVYSPRSGASFDIMRQGPLGVQEAKTLSSLPVQEATTAVADAANCRGLLEF